MHAGALRDELSMVQTRLQQQTRQAEEGRRELGGARREITRLEGQLALRDEQLAAYRWRGGT